MTTLPAWIEVDGALGDLSKLEPDLGVYAELARNWRVIAARVHQLGAEAPVDSPVLLAVYVAERIDDPALATVFDELGLGALHIKLRAVADRFTDSSSLWAKLLQPCDAFIETYASETVDGLDEGDDPGLVTLRIPPLEATGEAKAGAGSLSFGITAAAGLACEAGAAWPFRGDAVLPGLLRIGGSGKVTTTVGFALPFGQIGAGEVKAAASAEAMLSYFFRPTDVSMPFAEALVPALVSLPVPLDLVDINHAVELSGLEGLVVVCDGAVSAGLGATIGESFAIPNVASVTAGLVAELAFRRNARWLLSLRRTPSGLRFVLSRDQAREKSWSAGIDLAVDYSALAKRVHDIVLKAEGLAQPVLSQIKPFLSPGSYLTEQASDLLSAAVASITDNDQLRSALSKNLGAVLGRGGDLRLATADYLKQRIAELAATEVGALLADSDAWAQTIAAGLATKFPALGEAGLTDALAARLKPILGDVRRRFDGLIARLAADPAQSAALTRELRMIGIEVKGAVADADALLAGVRNLVERLDGFAQQVLAATGDGVTHKLRARFGWNGKNSSALHYELAGTISEVTADTSALWRALATGQLEPFQRILADPALAPPGLTLDPTSSLSRFAGRHRGFALEIVVLGVSASITSIVEGKATIKRSAGGNVVVAAEGKAMRDVDGFDEGRSATFISSWDLALLKVEGRTRRSMGVSLAFDHDDKDLQSTEVTGFLAGLARNGLVEQSRVQSAEAIYQGWRVQTQPGKKVVGRIDVRMALPSIAVERMVALGRLGGVKGSANQVKLFSLAGRTLMACGVGDEQRLERDAKEARREFDELEALVDPWRVMYALQDVDLDPPQSSVQTAHRYTAFGQLLPRAISFPKLLDTMARIYDAVPAGADAAGIWSAEDYARAEKELASLARKWLRINQKFIFWFKADLHPVMIAFLRLLANMNRATVLTDDPFAGLDVTPAVAETSRLFQITMSQPGEESVAL